MKMISYRISGGGFTIRYVYLHEGSCFNKYKKEFEKTFKNCIYEGGAEAYAARTPCGQCGALHNPDQAAKELEKRDRVLARAKRLRLAREDAI